MHVSFVVSVPARDQTVVLPARRVSRVHGSSSSVRAGASTRSRGGSRARRSSTRSCRAPGNPGMAALGECLPVDATDPAAVADSPIESTPDLVVVGPEEPLVAGVVDALQARGHLAFGPTAAAARARRLEGVDEGGPRRRRRADAPRYAAFDAARRTQALAFLETLPGLYVVKTDGLAAGKGVLVTESLADARDAVRAYLSGAAFGDAGRTLRDRGGAHRPRGVAARAVRRPRRGVPLAPAQDFKRVGDGDTRPEHRRHGRVLAGAGRGHRRARRRDDGARGRPDARRSCARATSSTAASSTPG